VAQSGYYNNLYQVTARELTDGRTDTGGWGSESTRTGNYLEAMYIRPVYVKSVTVGGGFIPSWRNYIKRKHGNMNLEYSVDGKSWLKVIYLYISLQDNLQVVNFASCFEIYISRSCYNVWPGQRHLFPSVPLNYSPCLVIVGNIPLPLSLEPIISPYC
jgi:hypothetical protein